jgi:hypothetical protein
MEDFRFITFAGEVQSPKRKEKKDVKVKGFVRKGRFIQAFQRKQLLNQKENNNSNNTDKKELAKKVAVNTAITGAALLGLSLATYGTVKLKYNRNFLKLGQQIKDGKNTLRMRTDIAQYKAPTKIGDDKDSLNFIFPGLPQNAEAAIKESKGTGATIKEGLKEINPQRYKKMEFINTGYSEMISEAAEKGFIKGDVANFAKKAAIKGESKDAIAIAQEIFDWHKLNPDKKINFFTHSAGGMIARDASHLLVNAGVPAKQIKMLATGSPNYGLVDDIVETKYIMHTEDIFGQVSAKTNNVQWVRSPAPNLDKIQRPQDKEFMDKSKLNYALGLHNVNMYWKKSDVNGTARSTQILANDFLFGNS